MTEITSEAQPLKKKKWSKYPHGEPRDPERVREIARLRDEEKQTWHQIGLSFGMTRSGASLLYKHWRKLGWLE
jgi:hypothetical protein